MKETVISKQNEGTKLLRILVKLLPYAEKNFLYKMLRKKNITLNDKKADGSELLKAGDSIKIFFSDETYDKFAGSTGVASDPDTDREVIKHIRDTFRDKYDAFTKITPDQVIYGDDDIILCNKPAGVLSQKAAPKDVSMVEYISEYLENKGEYDPGNVIGFKPAVANRLDRNTSGIIAAGKTVSGLKLLSEGFKKGEFEKLYLCVVKGEMKDAMMLKGLWEKSAHGNKVVIREAEPVEAYHTEPGKTDDTIFPRELFKKGNVPVLTYVQPVKSNGKATLCIVRLLTGKTHQIRAHLSTAGYPLLGDHKYGDRAFNGYYKDLYGTEFQLLHAYCLKIPEKGVFFADIPQMFEKLLKGEKLWEHGIQEVCGDLLSRI